ncbi:MAG TPA: hypothetical protein VFS62_15740 [Chloroflexota bacterium]|nr:hypothetical protein [Chloroflexota bacterium]
MSAAVQERAAVASAPGAVASSWQSWLAWYWLGFAAVIAVAAYTRLASLELMDFKADEAELAALAQAVAHGLWPATSIRTSLGPDNPPLPVYIFGLAALFSRNPLWLGVTNGLANLGAVTGVFVLGRRYFSPRIGLLAAALFAADAYATVFARKPAGTFLEPAGATLVVWALLATSSGRPRSSFDVRWLVAFAALGVLVQLHLGAALAAPLVGGLWLADVLGRRRGALAGGIVGLAVGAAVFAPYVAYELAHKSAFLSQLGSAAGGAGGAWSLESARLVWTLVSSPAYGDLTGAQASAFNAESWPAFWLAALIGLAALGGLVVALLRWRERRMLVLALWVVIPVVLTVHHSVGLQLHYFLFLAPALFLLAGLGADWVIARFRVAYAVVGALLLTQVLAFNHFTAFVRTHALFDSYGLPLSYEQRVLASAGPLAHGGRVIVATSGRDQAEASAYLLGDAPNVETDASTGLLLPADGGAYVTLTPGSPAADTLAALDGGASFTEGLPGGGRAAAYALTAPPDDGGVGLLKSLALTTGGGFSRAEPAPAWQNGLQLLGAAYVRNLPERLVAEWRVTGPVPASTMLFSQLLDDGGKQWFDADAVPADPGMWRAGDVLVTLSQASLPADAPRQEYNWWVGVYDKGGQRVPLTSGELGLSVVHLKGGVPSPPEPGLRTSNTTFGGAIRLDGYAINPRGISLQWTCLGSVNTDYTVFVHVLDPSGKVIGQHDSGPLDGHYPTSMWDAGETVSDSIALPIPSGAHLEIGLYEQPSGKRLTTQTGADHLDLSAP